MGAPDVHTSHWGVASIDLCVGNALPGSAQRGCRVMSVLHLVRGVPVQANPLCPFGAMSSFTTDFCAQSPV